MYLKLTTARMSAEDKARFDLPSAAGTKRRTSDVVDEAAAFVMSAAEIVTSHGDSEPPSREHKRRRASTQKGGDDRGALGVVAVVDVPRVEVVASHGTPKRHVRDGKPRSVSSDQQCGEASCPATHTASPLGVTADSQLATDLAPTGAAAAAVDACNLLNGPARRADSDDDLYGEGLAESSAASMRPSDLFKGDTAAGSSSKGKRNRMRISPMARVKAKANRNLSSAPLARLRSAAETPATALSDRAPSLHMRWRKASKDQHTGGAAKHSDPAPPSSGGRHDGAVVVDGLIEPPPIRSFMKPLQAELRSETMMCLAKQWAKRREDNGHRCAFRVGIVPGFDRRRMERRAQASNADLVLPLKCTACENSKADPCLWQGEAKYHRATTQLVISWCGAHGERQAKGGRIATAEQEEILDQSKARQVQGRLVAINKISDNSPPGKTQEQSRKKNVSFRRKKKKGIRPPLWSQKKVWSNEDIEDALLEHCADARNGNLPQELDKLALLSLDKYTDDEGKPCICAVITSRRLFETPKLLTNKNYVKIALDATFRELFGSFVTIPVGVLSKHYGHTTVDLGDNVKIDMPAFTTHFSPCLYVLASGENQRAAQRGLERVGDAPLDDAGRRMGPSIRQVHQDFAKSEENARVATYADSIGVKDFRHLIDRLKEQLPEKLTVVNAAGEKKHLDEILWRVRLTRTYCTTLTEFHHFWLQTFKQMEEWGEHAALEYLRGTYFFKVPRDIARAQYRCTRAVTEQPGDGLYCAYWWCSYARLQPGSASGSQALESFHAHEFRGSFVDPSTGQQLGHLEPPLFLQALQETVIYQGRQLAKAGDLFDRPNGTDPVTRNSDELRQLGRSTALDLWAKSQSCENVIHQISLPNLNGEAFVLPRSLLYTANGDGTWADVPEDKVILTAVEARRCAAMAVENDGRELIQMWRQIGILNQRRGEAGSDFSFKVWKRFRYHHLAVLHGPFVEEMWRTPTAGSPFYLCPCLPFALHGRCEHDQCIMAVQGHIDLRVPGNQTRGRPMRPRYIFRGCSSGAANAASIPAPCAAPSAPSSSHTIDLGSLPLRSDASAMPCPGAARPATTREGVGQPAARALPDDAASLRSRVIVESYAPRSRTTDFELVLTIVNVRISENQLDSRIELVARSKYDSETSWVNAYKCPNSRFFYRSYLRQVSASGKVGEEPLQKKKTVSSEVSSVFCRSSA